MGLSERLFGPGHDLHARQVDTSGSLLQAGGAMAPFTATQECDSCVYRRFRPPQPSARRLLSSAEQELLRQPSPTAGTTSLARRHQ